MAHDDGSFLFMPLRQRQIPAPPPPGHLADRHAKPCGDLVARPAGSVAKGRTAKLGSAQTATRNSGPYGQGGTATAGAAAILCYRIIDLIQ